uniref:Uncharacterized protein n=1 Tax=Arundo donax TaxID=35708 RepID=A0A0A8Z422_ARUDO
MSASSASVPLLTRTRRSSTSTAAAPPRAVFGIVAPQ